MSKKDTLSPSVRKSLEILAKQGGVRPKQFAKLYFPADHPGWKRHTTCGPKGVTRGGGLVMWGGGMLGKLRKLGFARLAHEPNDFRTFLTTAGREALALDVAKDLVEAGRRFDAGVRGENDCEPVE